MGSILITEDTTFPRERQIQSMTFWTEVKRLHMQRALHRERLTPKATRFDLSPTLPEDRRGAHFTPAHLSSISSLSPPISYRCPNEEPETVYHTV